MTPAFKIAILDMYKGTPNLGMQNIIDILDKYAFDNNISVEKTIVDIRGKQEIPTLDFDAFISTGGPGNPVEEEGWEYNYVSFIKELMFYNESNVIKKHAFFICHSFQVMCHHFNLGNVCLRKNESFGIFPVYPTDEGISDPIFSKLPRPFYIVDSRKWQVIEPNDLNLEEMGAHVLALEKLRPHVELERALMAIRFTPEMIGTQFHPEAEPNGMIFYLNGEEKKQVVIENYGKERYDDMLFHLNDPDKILLTQSVIIPQFLKTALTLNKLQLN